MSLDDLCKLIKTPSVVLIKVPYFAWEKLQEVFVILNIVVVVFLTKSFLRFRATFPCHRHSTVASQVHENHHQLWVLPQLLLIALLFRHIFTAFATVLSGYFFTHRRTLPCPSSSHFWPRFVAQIRARIPHPGSSSVPGLTKLFLLADAWPLTTHIVVTRRLIYQLQGRSHNLKDIAQNFTEVFADNDVIQRNQHRKVKKSKLEFHSNHWS